MWPNEKVKYDQIEIPIIYNKVKYSKLWLFNNNCVKICIRWLNYVRSKKFNS